MGFEEYQKILEKHSETVNRQLESVSKLSQTGLDKEVEEQVVNLLSNGIFKQAKVFDTTQKSNK